MLKWFGFGNGVVSGMLQFFKNDVLKAKKKNSSAASDFLCSIGISAPNPSSGFPHL